MNDFFSNLAARSFDHPEGIDLVRPRLPSLFEPAPEKRLDLGKFTSDLKDSEVAENSEWPISRSADGREKLQSNPSFEGRENPQGRVVRLPEDQERAPTRTITAAGDETHMGLSIFSARARTEMGERPVAHMKSSPIPAGPDPALGKGEPSHVVRQHGAERAEKPPKQSAVTPVAVQEDQMIEPTRRFVGHEYPSGEKESESRQANTARAAFQPAGAGINRREGVGSRRTVSKSEPTVNVTIGRIEVRAIMPGKVEKIKAAPSAMSLDEYLAGRWGGRS